MRRLPAGLLAIAIISAGCNHTSSPAANLVANTVNTVSQQQASAARAQGIRPIVISGPVGAEWDNEYNQNTPPAPRVEIPPAKPRANAQWVQGQWVWVTYRWLWLSGHWQ